MNIATLEEYVSKQNAWRKILGQSQLSLLNPTDRQEVADHIDGELSPENLHCDGEISRSEAMRKYRYLTKCAKELISIDPSVKMYEFSM